MHRRWFISKTNPDFLDYLSRSLSVSPVLSQLLINRGIKTAEAATDFLNPSLTALSDPFDLAGMDRAVERIMGAAQAGERVLVHGDYDADGLTATSILVRGLRLLGIDAVYFVPERMAHGYGFNPAAVNAAKQQGVRLIVTVDCGITALDAVAAASAADIDVVITDHHEPLRQHREGSDDVLVLPEAAALINPKLPGTAAAMAALSGAGVAFKLVQALSTAKGARLSSDDALTLIDLAALGTIADVVPLIGENRIIVWEGLRHISGGVRPGIRTLKDVCNLNGRPIKAGLLAFTLVPRINAAGRMADSSDVVRLMLTEDEGEAAALSGWLDQLNAARQAIEEEVYQEARAQVAELGVDGAIVLSGEGWHHGVLGIVASRIAEEFHRPTFAISVDDGVAKGSARSIPAFDICAALAECGELLIGFGGHKQAAGVKLRAADIRAFQKRMNELVRRQVEGRELTPSLEVDALVALSDISVGLVREIGMLEPFGFGNGEPLLGARGLDVMNPRVVGHNHLKMRLKKYAHSIDTIGFDLWSSYEDMDQPGTVDAVFTPGINEWNGNRYLQLVIKALRPSR